MPVDPQNSGQTKPEQKAGELFSGGAVLDPPKAGAPSTRDLQRSYRPVFGLLFWIGFCAFLASRSEDGRIFLEQWWWALALGVVVLLLLVVIEPIRKRVTRASEKFRLGLFVFTVLPLIVVV